MLVTVPQVTLAIDCYFIFRKCSTGNITKHWQKKKGKSLHEHSTRAALDSSQELHRQPLTAPRRALDWGSAPATPQRAPARYTPLHTTAGVWCNPREQLTPAAHTRRWCAVTQVRGRFHHQQARTIFRKRTILKFHTHSHKNGPNKKNLSATILHTQYVGVGGPLEWRI